MAPRGDGVAHPRRGVMGCSAVRLRCPHSSMVTAAWDCELANEVPLSDSQGDTRRTSATSADVLFASPFDSEPLGVLAPGDGVRGLGGRGEEDLSTRAFRVAPPERNRAGTRGRPRRDPESARGIPGALWSARTCDERARV